MTTKTDLKRRSSKRLAVHRGNGVSVDLERLPIIAVDVPVMYEDEGQDEMGDSEPHTIAVQILSMGVASHLQSRPELRMFSNLNLLYHPVDRAAYVSPDLMVVRPLRALPERVTSYRISALRPAPVLTIEILSPRSAQQQDLTNKPNIYSFLGIPECILVDVTGEFLEERLLLRRLQADGGWLDEKDADEGVTSRLGFRVLLDEDGYPRVIDAATNTRYLRPGEAQKALTAAEKKASAAERTAKAAERAAKAAKKKVKAESEARREAQERVKELEAELARLRGKPNA
jgi:Uma2 family endonuclease